MRAPLPPPVLRAGGSGERRGAGMTRDYFLAVRDRALRAGGGRLRVKPGCTCATCARVLLLRALGDPIPAWGAELPEVHEDARAS